MSSERAVRRWVMAGGALLLAGAGLFARGACAPAPPPAVSVPVAPPAPAASARVEPPTWVAERAAHGAVARGALAYTAAREPAASGAAGLTLAPALPIPAGAPGPSLAPATRTRGTPFIAPEPLAPAAAPDTPPPPARSGALPLIERQELALLASIERELRREPPPEVHALLGDYRRGADRDHLVARVRRDFPNDLALRVTTLRWIDDVRPGAEPHTGARPAALGQGTGAPWVRPLERR